MRAHSAIAVLLFCGAAAGCASPGAEDGDGGAPAPGGPTPLVGSPDAEAPTQTPEATGAADALASAQAVGANELGEIVVLMYHRIIPGGGGEYDRSPEEFRDELAYLHDHGYRPVRVIDVVRGVIDVPAGTSPVVLTFDDSTREQLAFTDTGAVHPDSAVGILLEFAEAHPDFLPTASFYVNANPFGGGRDSGDLLRWLHEHGFELGNHTAGHSNLRQLGPADVRRELAQGVRVVTDAVPGADVRSLALPLGIWPEPRELAYSGEWEGGRYEHEAVLLVGAHPARSPFHAEFDALAIPRVRSAGWDGGEPNFGSAYWLDVLERHPERRYVSDGDPERISFPAALADQLDPRFADRARPY